MHQTWRVLRLSAAVLGIYTGSDGFDTGSDKIAPNLFCDELSENESALWREKHGQECLHGAGNARIYGGSLTDTHDSWPYLVHVMSFKSQKDVKRGWYDQCGGTIIADRWIITAAHCFDGASHKVQIVLNEQNLDKSDASEQRIDVEEIFLHPAWNPKKSKVENDVALLRVPSLTRLRGCFRPACLPRAHARDGKWCHIAGWGKTDKRMWKDKLQEAGLNVLSSDYCLTHSHHKKNQLNFDAEFCAGHPDRNGNGLTDKGVDACQGDSGGPLICIENKQPVLYGIVSWGVGCGREGLPGLYSKVAAQLDWIGKVTRTNQNGPVDNNPNQPAPTHRPIQPTEEYTTFFWQGEFTTAEENRLRAQWSSWEKWSYCGKNCKKQRFRYCIGENKKGKEIDLKNSVCQQMHGYSERHQETSCYGGKCRQLSAFEETTSTASTYTASTTTEAETTEGSTTTTYFTSSTHSTLFTSASSTTEIWDPYQAQWTSWGGWSGCNRDCVQVRRRDCVGRNKRGKRIFLNGRDCEKVHGLDERRLERVCDFFTCGFELFF